jgi:hypothetical protein
MLPPNINRLLLLATDRVAQRLQFSATYPPPPDRKPQLDELATEGLTFTYSEMGGGYEYTSSLLSQLWRDYPSSAAGEDAFLLLLNHGFDTSFCWGNGSDPFREVIKRGEQFLAERPSSPHRPEVTYGLAQAYETWWSLSMLQSADEETGDPDPTPYRPGAGAALDGAITNYQKVVNENPQRAEAKCAVPVLLQLKEKKDTRQRRFYCYCD